MKQKRTRIETLIKRQEQESGCEIDTRKGKAHTKTGRFPQRLDFPASLISACPLPCVCCINLSLRLPLRVCPSVYARPLLSFCLSSYMCVCVPLCLYGRCISFSPPVCVCLFVFWLSVCLSVCLSVSLFVFVCSSVPVSLSLSSCLYHIRSLLCVCLFFCMFVCLPSSVFTSTTFLSVCLSAYCLSACLCLYVHHLSFCLCLAVFVCQSGVSCAAYRPKLASFDM